MTHNTQFPDDLQPIFDDMVGRLTGGKRLAVAECFHLLMRLREVREALKGQPLTVKSERSKATRCNPLVTLECNLRRQWMKLAKNTGLDRHYLSREPAMTHREQRIAGLRND